MKQKAHGKGIETSNSQLPRVHPAICFFEHTTFCQIPSPVVDLLPSFGRITSLPQVKGRRIAARGSAFEASVAAHDWRPMPGEPQMQPANRS